MGYRTARLKAVIMRSKGNPRMVILCASGALILLGFAFLSSLSHTFQHGEGFTERPIIEWVLVMMGLSTLHAVGIWAASGTAPQLSRKIKLWLWTVALGSRLILITSQPVQEDDFYRYMWDGHVCLQGVNPYLYSPHDIMLQEVSSSSQAPPDLLLLAGSVMDSPEASKVLGRVNHPELSTIYPPLLLLVFSISQLFSPWNLPVLRLTLLLFDIGGLLLLWKIVRALGRPQALWVAYAWCPLVIKEFGNSAHADSVVVFCILFFLWAVISGWTLRSHLALAAGVMAKIFPLVLLPFALLHRRQRIPTSWIGPVLVWSAAILLFIPMMTSLGEQSGTYAYATTWRKNSWLFPMVEAVSQPAGFLPIPARPIIAGILFGIVTVVGLRLRREVTSERVCRSCFIVVGALFCLLPAQFPWYLTWVLPFLALYPSPPLILLSGLIQLYYLGFWIDYQWNDVANRNLVDEGFRWLAVWQYVPFFILLLSRVYIYPRVLPGENSK